MTLLSGTVHVAAMVHLLHDDLRLGVISSAAMPVVLVIPHLGYIGVERPAITAGRWLTRPSRLNTKLSANQLGQTR